MLSTKITYALADWIREWIKGANQDPTLENCLQFVNWKNDNHQLSESDKLQIEAILLYETSENND